MDDALQLDDDFLSEAGLGGLSPGDKASLLSALHEELRLRAGTRISSCMTTAQLERFDELMQTGDEEGCQALLHESVPGYKGMVSQEGDRLAAVLRKRAPEILQERGVAQRG